MYSYSIFHNFSIRFHIHIRQKYEVSDIIRIHVELSSDRTI
jgi:hypothetical protein